ncbi:MAG: DUF4296 domain-containing protein [Bacteroidales bacterium]
MILNRSKIPITAFLLLFACIIPFSGCKQEKKITGKEYIHRKVLVRVIADIHLMDGITNDMSYYRKYNPGDSIDLYGPIFDKYNVNREMYDRTIKEYSKYPKLLDEVYDQVLMELKLLQDKIEMEEEERPEVIKSRNQIKTR